MSTKFGRLEFSGKKISFYAWYLNGMEMSWYSVRSFLFFSFCLEATFGQDTYKSEFRHCYGNFFESATPKVTMSQVY